MKPKIQIVDENDKVVGLKPRQEVDYAADIYRVAALWLTNSAGEVLIAQRKHTKDKDPGKWGPAVAGTMDKGETYESNIIKEAEEEIGLIDIKFEKGPKIRVTRPRNYFCQWFRVTLDTPAEDFVLQEDEVEQVKWIGLSVLKADINNNPHIYIDGMAKTVEMFSGAKS